MDWICWWAGAVCWGLGWSGLNDWQGLRWSGFDCRRDWDGVDVIAGGGSWEFDGVDLMVDGWELDVVDLMAGGDWDGVDLLAYGGGSLGMGWSGFDGRRGRLGSGSAMVCYLLCVLHSLCK